METIRNVREEIFRKIMNYEDCFDKQLCARQLSQIIQKNQSLLSNTMPNYHQLLRTLQNLYYSKEDMSEALYSFLSELDNSIAQ